MSETQSIKCVRLADNMQATLQLANNMLQEAGLQVQFVIQPVEYSSMVAIALVRLEK